MIGYLDELMLRVYTLHFPPAPKGRRLRIADVTFGQGQFWKKIDISKFDFFPLDRGARKNKIDFHKLPYGDDFLDVGVFDPPWLSIRVSPDRYDAATVRSPHRLMELYRAGNSRATAARKLAAVRSFARYLRREGLLDTDPAAFVGSPKR